MNINTNNMVSQLVPACFLRGRDDSIDVPPKNFVNMSKLPNMFRAMERNKKKEEEEKWEK